MPFSLNLRYKKPQIARYARFSCLDSTKNSCAKMDTYLFRVPWIWRVLWIYPKHVITIAPRHLPGFNPFDYPHLLPDGKTVIFDLGSPNYKTLVLLLFMPRGIIRGKSGALAGGIWCTGAELRRWAKIPRFFAQLFWEKS